MLPCLRISLSFSINTVHRHQHLHASARNALGTALHALRRSSTTAPPPLEQHESDQNDAFNASGLKFLCTLGLDTSSATALLEKAATPLDASQLEALCFALCTVVQIPVAKLPELFLNANPDFFSLTPSMISANYKAISGAWPSEKQLRASIISYPGILESSFPGELRRSMTSLRDMGFSTSQTAAAVIRCPELTKLRRYEITTALAQCGIISQKIEDAELFEMLSKNPFFLTPAGSKNLGLILEAIKKATGVTPQQAQHIVARCPSTLFQQDIKVIRHIVDLLLEFGLTQTQIGQAAVLWPNLVCRKVDRIQQTLQILSTYKVTQTQVASYPQVFQHHPERIVAPRLAFLKKNAPEKISSLSLVSLFSSTDEAFSNTFSKNGTGKSYLQYKMQSLVEYQLGNEAAQGGKKKTIGGTSVGAEEKEKLFKIEGTATTKTSSSSGTQVNDQKESRIASLVSKKQASPPDQKQESAEEKKSSNEKRKQHQQQQRRRFFKRTNSSSSKQKNKQQQQQLKRLTPEQIEKSKEKKTNSNINSKALPTALPQRQQQ